VTSLVRRELLKFVLAEPMERRTRRDFVPDAKKQVIEVAA
jgi:hypothetical protein